MSRPSDAGKPGLWRKRLARFSTSGMTVARFCAREGVSVASFYYWRKKLRRHDRCLPATRHKVPAEGAPAVAYGRFQQVTVVATRSAAAATRPGLGIQFPLFRVVSGWWLDGRDA